MPEGDAFVKYRFPIVMMFRRYHRNRDTRMSERVWCVRPTSSDAPRLQGAGYPFVPQGYMVWCALIYADLASFVSWRVGRRLIPLNAERCAREADFRFALVRVNEEVEGVTWRRGGRKGKALVAQNARIVGRHGAGRSGQQ
jgi:hypothetical protein